MITMRRRPKPTATDVGLPSPARADVRSGYERALEAWGTAIVRAMVTWVGLLELPDPERCRVCGARMGGLQVWNTTITVGHACTAASHGERAPRADLNRRRARRHVDK